jgi:hypothetical protein
VPQFQVRAHADFAPPLILNADTRYWIGMSGTLFNLGQHGLIGSFPDVSRMAQFLGATYVFPTATGIGDMAFRLHGTVLPEPSTAFVISCVVGCALKRRIRRSS